MPALPKFVAKFFWGDNPKELSLTKHSKYISETLLDSGDLPAIRWLFKKRSKNQLKKTIGPKMTKKSRNFWKMYLG